MLLWNLLTPEQRLELGKLMSKDWIAPADDYVPWSIVPTGDKSLSSDREYLRLRKVERFMTQKKHQDKGWPL